MSNNEINNTVIPFQQPQPKLYQHNRPWMPFYIGDFLQEIVHLDDRDAMVYLRLLIAYWRRGGPLPDNDRYLRKVGLCHHKRWMKIKNDIAINFKVIGGVWIHDLLEKQLLNSSDRSAAGVRANSVRWSDRSPKSQVTSHKDKKDIYRSIPPEPTGKEIGTTEEGFERFWKAYPRRKGSNPKQPAKVKFLSAVQKGASIEELISAARGYAEEQAAIGKVGSEYVAQAVTWLNQQRYLDYHTANGNGAPPGMTAAEKEAWVQEEMRKFREANRAGAKAAG